ncbi:hypothetical protein BDN72DRAFT_790782 [Pluteus cervinus]|uniref:Uncharacterized protein n=1 Tax=Pluteus cervinus TaxID=181527 RepID=A0ACD3B6D0_9AGAR|nr:hypothetical protein BDN72DRAFT_790782 [Pluteus cervinus]
MTSSLNVTSLGDALGLSPPQTTDDSAMEPIASSARTVTPPQKKRRHIRGVARDDKSRECKFMQLPLELLNIIFEILVPYPRYLIALTRCNKYLQQVLLDDASEKLWVASRNSFFPNPPQLPNGLGFTEAQYTFLLFSDGVCEVCQNQTMVKYASFSLQLRLCARTECRTRIVQPGILTQIKKKPQPDELSKAVRRLERGNPLFSQGVLVCRSREWSQKQRKFREDPEVFASWPLMTVYNEFFDKVYEWARNQERVAHSFISGNTSITSVLAEKYGATNGDLKSIPCYKALFRECADLRVKLEPEALERIANETRTGLQRMKERGQNRSYEKNYEVLRTKMWEHYSLLQGDQAIKPFPSWRTFFRLPVIASYVELLTQEKLPQSQLIEQIEAQDFLDTIRSQIDKWVTSSRENLLETLGLVATSDPGDVLSILEWPTSRFRCSACKNIPSWSDDGSFDFLGVCAHNCRSPDKEGKSWEWKASNFVKDEKASRAMEMVLQACQTRAGDPRCTSVLESIGARILCQSCEPAVVMRSESVPGHAHRHDDMKVKLLPEAEALQIRKHPLIPGLSKHLSALGKLPKDRDVRMRNIFVCLHCQESDKPRLFTMHGLRSHVMIKHAFQDLRDEDYYTQGTIDLGDAN